MLKNRRDTERFLKENGFRLDRECKHGYFWVDDHGARVLQSRPGSNGDPRGQRNFERDVLRAVERRPKPASVEPAKESKPMLGKPWVPVIEKPEPLKVPMGVIAPIKSPRGARLAGSKRFTKEKRDEVRGLILDCRKEQKSISEIVEILNTLGVKTPDDKPVNRAFVMNQLSNMRNAGIIVDFDKSAKTEAKAEVKTETKAVIVPAVVKPEPVRIIAQTDDLRSQIRSIMDWKIADKMKLQLISALVKE